MIKQNLILLLTCSIFFLFKTTTTMQSQDKTNQFKMDQNIFNKIFEQHIKKLKYTEILNKPFFIFFSATPGMGKTYLSMILEDHYKALRISSRDLRSIARSININPDQKITDSSNNTILHLYTLNFVKENKFPNKFIILDASIDRSYKTFFPILQAMNLKFVVIKLEVPLNLAIERYIPLPDENKKITIKLFPRWEKEYLEFNQNYLDTIKFDMTEKNPNLDSLIQAIDIKIQESQITK